jgi:hypothetical protein
VIPILAPNEPDGFPKQIGLDEKVLKAVALYQGTIADSGLKNSSKGNAQSSEGRARVQLCRKHLRKQRAE